MQTPLTAKVGRAPPQAESEPAREATPPVAQAPAPENALWRAVSLGATVQRKPAISEPGDPAEQEADAVADQVMRMAEPDAIGAMPPAIQRQCAECDAEYDEKLQRKDSGGGDAGVAPSSGDAAVQAARHGGTPLEPAARARFEPRFGRDFGQVRVHADPGAASAAHAVQASAYTVGRDIVFGSGQYQPDSPAGQRLLAHELAHVVQQGAAQDSGTDGARVQRKPKVDEPPPKKAAPPIGAQPHTQGSDGRKSHRLLVLLWDPHRDNQGKRPTQQQIDDAVFGSQPTSLREFYNNQSGGKEAIDKVAVLGWYDAKKPADHYWNHPKDIKEDGYVDGHNEKWAEALHDADDAIDFKSFDDNHDGRLTPDELSILFVIPQAASDGTSLHVPEGPNHTPLVLDGVTIDQTSEVYMPWPIDAGMFRHELGHLLFGLLDTYSNQTYPQNGAGDYSIMAISRGDAQIDAPTRIGKGWITDNPIARSGTYAIGSIENTHEAFTYTRPGSKPREYFAIEKREPGNYDKQLPLAGLVIWRKVDGGNPESLYRFTPQGRPAWPMDQALSDFPLTWSDGKDSGVRISVDPKTSGMAFTIVIPTAAASSSGRP